MYIDKRISWRRWKCTLR